MKTSENRRYGMRVLGRDVLVSDDTRLTGLNSNDIIIGGSGAGKTGSVVIPTIQKLKSSLIVSDTKGQLERRFKDELIEKGYTVKTIDFVNPERSNTYNPLMFIRRYNDGSVREQDIMVLARSIVPILDVHEPFWEQSAASLVAFLIAYCVESMPQNMQHMKTVYELYQMFISPDESEEYCEMLSWMIDHPKSLAARKYTEIKSNKSAEKMYSSILGFASVALEPFGFKEAGYIFGRSAGVDLANLGRKKTVLFINVSDTEPVFDKMVNLLYLQALFTLCAEADRNPDGRLNVPVRIIMDDFAASAKIENFDKITSVIRSRDIFVTIILQSLSQLESMYTKSEANTIINNCDHMLYMSGQDESTIQYIASRAFKTPESVQTMPRNMAYLLVNGEKAKLVEKIVPYSTVSDYMCYDMEAERQDDFEKEFS